jgi:hypothetical protein
MAEDPDGLLSSPQLTHSSLTHSSVTSSGNLLCALIVFYPSFFSADGEGFFDAGYQRSTLGGAVNNDNNSSASVNNGGNAAGGGGAIPSRITLRLCFLCAVSAIGGFLFGYDTGGIVFCFGWLCVRVRERRASFIGLSWVEGEIEL